jgi:hypothetical protein
VRQGRYLFFGYDEVPDTLSVYAPKVLRSSNRMGVLFFVNLIDEMRGY